MSLNYIRQLNAFFDHVRHDTRLTSFHVALYMALFHYWNVNRFISPISVPREDLMKLSAMGSKNTYLKSLRQLEDFGYIKYQPGSGNFFKNKIYITVLNDIQKLPTTEKYCPKYGPDTVPDMTLHCPKYGPGTVPYLSPLIKQNANIINNANSKSLKIKNDFLREENVPSRVPNMGQIKSFFQEQNFPEKEAIKFFNFYESIGWLAGGRTPIRNWQAAAKKWMLNNFQNQKIKSNVANNHLHTSHDLNYSEPF